MDRIRTIDGRLRTDRFELPTQLVEKERADRIRVAHVARGRSGPTSDFWISIYSGIVAGTRIRERA